eukprot:TRINITY_DN18347_c0_g1_i1.p1 TRINITY_DN18347_c0_g1~~TRINITY_DN18347_c0_g1_i1.p1  ORF type:complete len:476 (-),score=184.00 TRINITY_DN18347_c0_g1_i1:71-1405(-)
MESFRTPHFAQMHKLVLWLAQRYDPGVVLPTEVSSEEERVNFVKVLAQEMLSKAQIKINTKKLYMADVYAVKEMLKIAKLLSDSTKETLAGTSSYASDGGVVAEQDSQFPTTWVQDLKEAMKLASEIMSSGMNVHGMLENEVGMQEQRLVACGGDLEQIKKAVQLKTKSIGEDVTNMQQKLEVAVGDEANLRSKLDNRRQELEQNVLRLRRLQSIRPTYMDEYEKLEQELQQVYGVYLVRFRNLNFLESELDKRNKAEVTKHKKRKKMFEQLKQNELLEAHEMLLRGAQTTEADETYADEDDDGRRGGTDEGGEEQQYVDEEAEEGGGDMGPEDEDGRYQQDEGEYGNAYAQQLQLQQQLRLQQQQQQIRARGGAGGRQGRMVVGSLNAGNESESDISTESPVSGEGSEEEPEVIREGTDNGDQQPSGESDGDQPSDGGSECDF